MRRFTCVFAYLTGRLGPLSSAAQFPANSGAWEAIMDQTMPILLVPGLASSARIYAPVIPSLWRFGPVMGANHIRDDNMAAIARRGVREAAPRLALARPFLGGDIPLPVMRPAPRPGGRRGFGKT